MLDAALRARPEKLRCVPSGTLGLFLNLLFLCAGCDQPRSSTDTNPQSLQARARWVQLSDGGGTQSPRSRHNSCLVLNGQKLCLIGGESDQDQLRNDQWSFYEFDLQSRSWRRVETSGDRPPPLKGAALIYYKDQVFCFGGRTIEESPVWINGFWRFDMKSARWSKISSPICPSPRIEARLIATDNGLLLFSGVNSTLKTLGDLWSFEPTTESWTKLSDRMPISQEEVDRFSAVWFLGKLCVFGLGETPHAASLWQFDTDKKIWTEFTEKKKVFVGDRIGAQLVSDGTVILRFGGKSLKMGGRLTNDLWRVSNDYEMREVLVGVLKPLPRLSSFWFDGKRLFMFGGVDDTGEFHNDLWLLEFEQSK